MAAGASTSHAPSQLAPASNIAHTARAHSWRKLGAQPTRPQRVCLRHPLLALPTPTHCTSLYLGTVRTCSSRAPRPTFAVVQAWLGLSPHGSQAVIRPAHTAPQHRVLYYNNPPSTDLLPSCIFTPPSSSTQVLPLRLNPSSAKRPSERSACAESRRLSDRNLLPVTALVVYLLKVIASLDDATSVAQPQLGRAPKIGIILGSSSPTPHRRLTTPRSDRARRHPRRAHNWLCDDPQLFSFSSSPTHDYHYIIFTYIFPRHLRRIERVSTLCV